MFISFAVAVPVDSSTRSKAGMVTENALFFSQPSFVLLENEGYSGWSEATVSHTQVEEIRTKFGLHLNHQSL